MHDKTFLPRLLHLASPSLPTGAFAYSQGLEWAVEAGWVRDGFGLRDWLDDLLRHSMARVDVPILKRMHAACESQNEAELEKWCSRLLALRETRELRTEEKDRGAAMTRLLQGLAVPFSRRWENTLVACQLAGFALAACQWGIPPENAATGYVWSWLENQAVACMKTLPLGQTEGHRILSELAAAVPETVKLGLQAEDREIGSSNPALAVASSLHESQYSRLYRS